MERSATVDIDDLRDPIPVDELQRFIIIEAFHGAIAGILARIKDKVITVKLFRSEMIQFLQDRVTDTAEKLGGRTEKRMKFQMARSRRLP